MPLQRLELYNFKSYKGSQVIEFGDAPFMCIIGPNGAGKSNLMDAISFVLGVKSAQLRSTQLRDLIYRGRRALDDEESQTLHDDPTSAHVTAVYLDDGGKEWKFKRSISSTGQSAYHLNSRETTYKAYNAQLEKFNVLVKAKNFLVFQGDVESVASQDSKELSKLIDRISGSAELARQYEEAKMDLERTAEASTTNYNKKRSMQSEARIFREQKEEVDRWERLQHTKDTLVQKHFLWRLLHLTNEINESTRKVEEANEKLSDLRHSVGNETATLSGAKKEAAQATLLVRQHESAALRAEKAVDEKKPELVTIDAQISHAERKVRDSEAIANRVERDLARQTASLDDLIRGAAEIEEQMKMATEEQQKNAANTLVLSKAEQEEYRHLRTTANAQMTADRQQAEALKREAKPKELLLASLEDKMRQAEERKARLATEVESLEGRLQAAIRRRDALNDDKERTKATLEQAQSERERISVKETELNEKLQDTYAKLLSAGADRRESEREAKFRETLNNLKRVFPGVHGRIIDLCKPTVSKYTTAVMTVLGRNVDAIVVEHEKVAIDCIEFMRNQRAGHATFIPLDTIQVKAVQEKYRNYIKGGRLAIDCIEYDPSIERAMQHVCGSAMICDSMAIAKYICYDKSQEVKAVTLDGTVIHKSGLITGGMSSSSRRFNDNDVQSLQQARDAYMKQLAELHQARPKVDDGLLIDLRRLDAELAIANDDLDAIRLRLDGLRGEIEHINRDLADYTPDYEAKKGELEQIETKLQEIEARLSQSDDGIFAEFCRKIEVDNIRDYERMQSRVARAESEAIEKYKIQQARLERQMEFERSQLQTTKNRLSAAQGRIERAKKNIEDLSKTKTRVDEEIAALQAEAKSQRDRVQASRNAQDDCMRRLEQARESSRKMQRSLDKALKEIAGWNDEIERRASDRHALYRRCRLEEIDLPLKSGRLDRVPIEEAAQAELDEDGDTQLPRRIDDFGIEPDFDVLDEDDEDPDPAIGERYESEIARIKADLEKLVPNVKAIDRLADVEAGLDEAEREAEDTRRENRSAKERFQELKKKRCDLFNKAYSHMSGCIDQIYKDLTKSTTFQTGGVAFLSLEDAEEPYMSGVKYNVMPPGKAFVDMEQLSGGEKTMAALGLLFAIHSFHPAPFFVLDEVDAALDPTNVAKLARYVRKQAEDQVQFLIISLKSALYEHADGLVGVYREQDANTSKSLTLDLRQYVE